MRYKVRKAYINFEKEEKWLNEMADKGMNMVDYTFLRYFFEEGTPGEFTYRIELLNNMPEHPESRAYLKFMEETGAECVTTYMRWVYFRKKKMNGVFDLYSDYDSRIQHYKRVLLLLGVVGGMNLLLGITNLLHGTSAGAQRGFYGNVYIAIANWLVVLLLAPSVINFYRKIRRMGQEKQLFE